ncbi:hypothetical protein [Zhihengliuella salsuginis]|uniref:Uncharacterized protein n=1 Tax=Zhihengliuella salsuginis TaxID=578222 RepID=A0ABQ3GIB4_9MICC|nr:hypothetical protein [Zhihengliuella salsuginis]GHD08508.1 hypothetical protein GCM10008096_20230 [Zhihengliuella salsuginis]
MSKYVRILTAIVAIVLGAAALVAGIGQKTFWAPSETLTAAIPGSVEEAPLTVIESGVDEVNDEPIEITVKGDGEFLLALGRSSDVDAWVGDASVNRVTEVDAEERVLKTVHEGSEDVVPNPKGSDLWVAEDTVEGETVYTWTEPAEGDWSLLLAADGTEPAPTDISVEWPNTATTPFSLGLIIVGALLVLFGLLRLLWPSKQGGSGAGAADDSTREVPEVDGKNGHGSVAKRLTAAVATVALTFSGATAAQAAESESAEPTSSESSPSPAEEQADDAPAHPVLMESQLERILADVERVVGAADESLDRKGLRERMTGDALSRRSANFGLRHSGVEMEAPEPIDGGNIRSAAVPSEAGWPRQIVVVTQSDGPVPLVNTLQQLSPRDNYKVVSSVSMLPASSFPGLSPKDDRVRMLEPGAGDGLSESPEKALDNLAAFLNEDSEEGQERFEENTFIDALHGKQNELKDANEDFGAVSFERSVNKEETVALSVPDAGAVVVGSITSTVTVEPKEEGGTIAWGDEDPMAPAYAKITGVDETSGPVDFTYSEPVVLYVPASGEEGKIRVIAAQSMFEDVTIEE